MRKQPCFFVQNNCVERITAPVALYARQVGARLEDRSSTSEFDADDCGVDWSQYAHVLPVGSVQFLRHLKKSVSLGKYILHDEVSFAATTWRDRLGAAMLNEAGQTVRVVDVAGALAGAAMHVRPHSQDKAFNAKVFDITGWAEMRAERNVADDLLCWASPVRDISAEWRCWVIGGHLTEISQYRLAGQSARVRGAPTDVAAFAADVVHTWLPAACVVMDIARTPQGLRLLEFNPINGSGWYAADVPTVLGAWLAWARTQE